MANATVSIPGQINGSGDTKALYLKVASGEVLAAFTRTTAFMERHIVRNITAGKSAQFPATGRTTARYHTPGTEIVGQVINGAERTINIDDVLLSDVFLSNFDEAMSHFEVRGEYTRQLGEALAMQFDQNVARVGILAARASATVTGLDGGSQIINANYRTVAATLADGIYAAAQLFDEKWVAGSEKAVFLKPAQYHLLAKTADIVDKDRDGDGSFSKGTINYIAGLPMVKTNNLPTADDSSNAAIPTAYRGNFASTAALIMERGAVGTVKLQDLATEEAYDIRRQGTLFVAKYLVGHGILRPECAVELAIA